MLRHLRKRPRLFLALGILLLLVGGGAGGYAYALHQWDLAQVALEEGRLDDAQERLAFCLRIWPDSVPVQILAARADRMQGAFPEAEAHLNRCLELQGGANDEVQIEFLLMRVQTGEVEEVTPTLLLYVDEDHPQKAMILETLAGAYMRDLRYGQAYAILERWVAEFPESATAYHWRGWVLERLEAPEPAVRDYLHALELKPDLVSVRLRLAEIYLKENSPQEALPHLERLRAEYPDRADVKARMGQCRLMQNRFDEARELLEAAYQERPDDPQLLLDLAKLEMNRDPGRSEKLLRSVLRDDPGDIDALYALITSLKAQERWEEADELLQHHEETKEMVERANRLLRAEAENPSRNPEPAWEIGTSLLKIGRQRLGVYWLHQALERDPTHQPSHRALAEFFQAQGDDTQAAAHRRQLTANE